MQGLSSAEALGRDAQVTGRAGWSRSRHGAHAVVHGVVEEVIIGDDGCRARVEPEILDVSRPGLRLAAVEPEDTRHAGHTVGVNLRAPGEGELDYSWLDGERRCLQAIQADPRNGSSAINWRG